MKNSENVIYQKIRISLDDPFIGSIFFNTEDSLTYVWNGKEYLPEANEYGRHQ